MVPLLIAGAISLAASLLGTRYLIDWLKAHRVGQPIHEDVPDGHITKAGTPTMGGVAIVVAAVVLSLLGVDDAVIAHDYGLSRFGMAELLAWLELELPDAHAALLAHPPAYLDAPPSAIRHLLGEIRRRWGTIEGFADSLYLDERAIARIRSNLLVEI